MLPSRYPTEAPSPAPAAGITSNSDDSVALFTVVVLFGALFLLLGLSVWCWYPSALEEGRGDGGTAGAAAPATAASRVQVERARLEYVHKVLKTRSWHGASVSATSLRRANAAQLSIAAALAVSSGDGNSDGDAGRGGAERSIATAPPHLDQDPHRRPDQESGLSTTEQRLPRVSNESTTAIQFPGPLDSKNRPGDEGDKNTGTDEDDAIDQAGDIDSGLPECAICLCPFKEHETVCESSNRTCTHQYHPECLEPWLVLHEECPVCREAYLPSQRQLSSRKRWSCGGAPGGRDTARP